MCQGRPESPRPVTMLVASSLEYLPRLAAWVSGSRQTPGGVVVIVLQGHRHSVVTFVSLRWEEGAMRGSCGSPWCVCVCVLEGEAVSVLRVSTGAVDSQLPSPCPTSSD